MRWNKMLVVASAVVLAGTACGTQGAAQQQPPASEQSSTEAPGAPPSSEDKDKPAPPESDDGPDQPPAAEEGRLPAEQIEAASLPEGFPKEVTAKDNGATLRIVAMEGGCGKASAELAEQTDKKVAVTLVETEPKDAQACTMDIRYPTVTVQLDKPLGERTVELTYEPRKS